MAFSVLGLSLGWTSRDLVNRTWNCGLQNDYVKDCRSSEKKAWKRLCGIRTRHLRDTAVVQILGLFACERTSFSYELLYTTLRFRSEARDFNITQAWSWAAKFSLLSQFTPLFPFLVPFLPPFSGRVLHIFHVFLINLLQLMAKLVNLWLSTVASFTSTVR